MSPASALTAPQQFTSTSNASGRTRAIASSTIGDFVHRAAAKRRNAALAPPGIGCHLAVPELDSLDARIDRVRREPEVVPISTR